MGSILGNENNVKMEENELCSFAMSITSGTVVPMVLNAVIELDVLEIIKRAGPGAFLTPAQIVTHLTTTNPEAGTMLDRMLRLLASYSIVSCSTRTMLGSNERVERCYGLTPVCQFLTKDDDGVTLGAIGLVMQDKVIMESWYHLKDAVLNGGSPFQKAYNMSAFEYFGMDSRFNRIFNNGMANHSIITLKKIIENYRGFERISTLVDIGGGNGATLDMIISKYPNVRGINLDLPHVLATAPAYHGVEHVPGDMFVSIPKGDAMFMKWITHDWSDEHCMKLFKNCSASLPDHGKVIVCDYILPVSPESSYAAKMVFQYDVLMMANCPGGKERTLQEFEVFAKGAGFDGPSVACSAYDTKVIEFIKKPHYFDTL
ncbi:caffeic acid 3-O-methyltransferase-like [Silene latifolia]|uniref:caffeic acid 3-O-methyltransferase-like n=1 Tax=Silene latifolia TaxID=37657 RepID=UPI003D78589B